MPFTLEQLGTLSEKTLLFLLIFKKNGKIIAINNRSKILFPCDIDDIKGKNLTDFIIDDDVPIFKSVTSTISDKNPIINQSFSFPTQKEGVLSLKLDLIYYNDLIYATGLDTTEEYKEHRALVTISQLTKTGAWYYNPKNKDMYWSKGCYLIKELAPDTPITREKGIGYYPIKTRKKVESYLNNLIKDKEPYEYTEKIITEKGNEKWVKVVAHPVIYKGEVVFVNGTIADVTERYNYIEKLRQNEETKHLALKGIRSGLFDHLIEKNVVFYSEDFKKMLGLPLEEDFFPEEAFRKMIHPDDAEDALQRHLDNLKQEGPHYYNHYRLKLINGEYRHYEVYGFKRKNKKGKTIRMIGNLIDVHQRKLNEKAIANSRNRLQAMVNNGFAYTVLLDTNGKILMTDEASLKIIKQDFNVNPYETPCQFIDVTPLNFKNTFAHEFNEALKGNIVRKEIERTTNKGNIMWLESKYTPIFDNENIINSVLISFHDITEQKLADLSIKEAHIKEQELSELKSNILSNFSHEIRTPLNGIITISKLLIENNDPEEQKELIGYLEESKDRLLDTITNLSNFSEIESIQKNLNYNEVDTNYLVETSFREYRHMANVKNLKYRLELDETSPVIKIDEALFKPALDNIIHNAIKYTKKGGILIKIYSVPSKNNIYISIQDTGIGIKKAFIKKIFEPFIQESIGLSRKYEGTGIGLSLSKRYIEILGGKIKVKSKVGKGTEFIIIIPKSI
ncbi:PAS domain-containing sensor histidine kinase [Aquimarina sp. 2201CG5-10]|uniref:sensor histidine kinase n=1 Tax=Aquimarina callyspongiae TaxID=3098150 RepID=UPI002AB54E22|nr:PAS domain-containing sensor histidine kinase [Aquimarina sp. 2201CG5-10]MDY8138328.1 PAS domain-containing sensor histidine kinase [Aquimarina sp. 2201CG5-10]